MRDALAYRLAFLLIALVPLGLASTGCEDETNVVGEDTSGGGDTSGPPAGCEDNDDDGYFAGDDCDRQPADCNDHNPDAHPDADEDCDKSIDNNCDGTVNENCPCDKGERRLCSSYADNPRTIGSEMHCKPGIQRCQSNGEWGEDCFGEVEPRDQETCNNVDDDCDGEIDEGVVNSVNQCKDNNPNDPMEQCGPSGEGNGLDDDGDGEVDEDCSCEVPDYDPDLPRKEQTCYTGPIWTLGVGICEGGTMDCRSDGTWGQCQGEVLPDNEQCGDGVDNDCDGHIDEGCENCTDPSDETCNGEDDDCDGIIDEGVLNSCGTCSDEVSEEEQCGDGLDNNCNGQIDEGCGCTAREQECFPGPPSKAGVGACNKGTQKCVGESFGACEEATEPTLEKCGEDGTGNGIDDDCDGEVDEGCGCDNGETRPCGSSVGACERGTQTCKGGTWGDCEGNVEAESQEICNGEDSNCNGLVDDGVKNACGKCNEPCYTHDPDPQNDGDSDDGVTKIGKNDPDNPTNQSGLTLTEKTSFPPYLWAANHTHDTVSKFHTDKEKEVGRYWVGNNPSRTAVDLDGNMWVIGRDDGRLTKVISDTSECTDRNGNGQIDTSEPGNLGPINSAQDPMADECVAYSEVINPNFPSGRGVTVDASGRVWVAYSHTNPHPAIQPIDPNTFKVGQAFTATNIPVYKPDGNGLMQKTGNDDNATRKFYGLIGDSMGHLWVMEWAGVQSMLRFNTNTMKWDRYFKDIKCGTYGIALDAQNRVFGGCSGGGSGVVMYDPSTNKLTRFRVPNSVGNPPNPKQTAQANTDLNGSGNGDYRVTALSVEPATGDVWTTFYTVGWVGRLNINNSDLSKSEWTFIDAWPNAQGATRGIGFGRNGYAWHLGPNQNETAKIDPNTNAQDNTFSVGVGGHYTYSDFTGSTALSFTAPKGSWTYYFDTQFTNAQPDEIILEGHVPQDTQIEARIRAVDTNHNPTSNWLPMSMSGNDKYFTYPEGKSSHTIDLASAMGGGIISGRVFEVEVRLGTQNANKRPILHDVKLKWQRP